MNKVVFRKSDHVKIIKPDFFVRCGYPMDVKTEQEKIIKESSKEITALMRSLEVKGSLQGVGLLKKDHLTDRLLTRISFEIAYGRCKSNHFGGPQRTIHTKTIQEHLGKEFKIVDIKTVKTGIYSSSDSWYNYDYGCEEFEPAELLNQESHRIASLIPLGRDLWCEDHVLLIEVKNLEKINEK